MNLFIYYLHFIFYNCPAKSVRPEPSASLEGYYQQMFSTNVISMAIAAATEQGLIVVFTLVIISNNNRFFGS